MIGDILPEFVAASLYLTCQIKKVERQNLLKLFFSFQNLTRILHCFQQWLQFSLLGLKTVVYGNIFHSRLHVYVVLDCNLSFSVLQGKEKNMPTPSVKCSTSVKLSTIVLNLFLSYSVLK